jgi:hypothetical protein
MNTNDLPPAAKLAALIEAGRAANPDLKHGMGAYLQDGAACAIGFATLACGVSRSDISRTIRDGRLMEAFPGISNPRQWQIFNRVEFMNDGGATLEQITRELREGELAKA